MHNDPEREPQRDELEIVRDADERADRQQSPSQHECIAESDPLRGERPPWFVLRVLVGRERLIRHAELQEVDPDPEHRRQNPRGRQRCIVCNREESEDRLSEVNKSDFKW